MNRAFSLVSACLALLAACSPAGGSQAAAGVDPICFSRSSAKIGGPFQLTATDGRQMTEKDFAGRRAIVFFGYTYCPDVCPLALFNLGKALQDVPEAKRPVTLFVSVDPQRDTPEKLAQYIRSNGFPKDIVGLTGTIEQLSAMSEHFPPKFEPAKLAAGEVNYQVAHSPILYVMGKDWNLQTFFRDDEAPKTIASCLSALD